MLNRLMLLIVPLVMLVLAAGCDGWVEKLAPSETAFARHCFSLLQRRDFAAIETLAAPSLRTDDFPAHLADMAALIPPGDPISSHATSVNISTTNGYTVSTVSMEYQFPSGWLKFDIAAEGSGDVLPLTWISLGPTAAPMPVGYLPFIGLVPVVVIVLVLIGRVVFRRRLARRQGLQTTPEEMEQQQTWSAVLDEDGARTSWFDRLLGIRRVALNSPLSPEQCRARLKHSIEGEWALFRWGQGPRSNYEGAVGKSSFRFTRRRSIFFGNRYPTFLYGRWLVDGTGARMQCHVGPQRLVLALAGVFLFFFWVVFPVGAINQVGLQPSALLALLFPLIVTAFMAVGAAAGRRRVLKDGPDLLDFLSQTLEATPAPVARSGSIERTVRR